VLQLLRPWADGTTQIVFDPRELIEKLAALVPRPMANHVRYHGYLAPAAPWRAEIVPATPEPVVAQPPAITSPDYDPACQLPAEHGVDAGQHGRYLYMAMEFVEGESVQAYLEREGRMSERYSIEIAYQISLALEYAGETT